uniref:Uncharacterized protein n=1 Tax=Romanomermis culicivorax TaxID=13658 RepID=A0A915IAX6_ROMCU
MHTKTSSGNGERSTSDGLHRLDKKFERGMFSRPHTFIYEEERAFSALFERNTDIGAELFN